MLLENLLIKDYKHVMNAETDQFGRPLGTSSNINEKTDQSAEINDALDTIKEEINTSPDQNFEPVVDLQDQVNDSKNIDSIETPVTEESASTKDPAEDFTPSAPEETITEDFNVDSTSAQDAKNEEYSNTSFNSSAESVDNSVSANQENQSSNNQELTPDSATINEYQVQLIKMMQLIQSQNLQILGLSKKLDDIVEQRQLEKKTNEKIDETKQDEMDKPVIAIPPTQKPLDQGSPTKQTTSTQIPEEKTRLQLTFLGGTIFIIFFIFIILTTYSYLVIENILPLSSSIPGYLIIESIIDSIKPLFFWL